MYPFIYKYLVQHKKVGIPGIGHFTVVRTPATVSSAGVLQPPTYSIQYKEESVLADKSFFKYLANELHAEEVETIKNFHEFTYQLKDSLQKAEGVIFPGIGTLKKTPAGALSFQPQVLPNNYFTTVEANTTTLLNKHDSSAQKNYEPNLSNVELEPINTVEEQRDYWWVFAIVIAVASIAAIVYKFF